MHNGRWNPGPSRINNENIPPPQGVSEVSGDKKLKANFSIVLEKASRNLCNVLLSILSVLKQNIVEVS